MHITDKFRSREYAEGVTTFIILVQAHAIGSDQLHCPCSLCSNNIFLPIKEVEGDLLIIGIDPNYVA